jgi:hypothetical protein
MEGAGSIRLRERLRGAPGLFFFSGYRQKEPCPGLILKIGKNHVGLNDMRFLRIFFFTLIWSFLGFIVGYLLFARWGNEFIPIKSIFMSDRLEDAVLNGWMNIRMKVSATSGAFGLAGLLVILFIEFKGGTAAPGKKEKVGFYECKYCGFKAPEKTSFCEACERDETGLTKEDYKRRAEEKVKKV